MYIYILRTFYISRLYIIIGTLVCNIYMYNVHTYIYLYTYINVYQSNNRITFMNIFNQTIFNNSLDINILYK